MGVRDGAYIMNRSRLCSRRPRVAGAALSGTGRVEFRAAFRAVLFCGAAAGALAACQPAQSASSQPTISLRMRGTPSGATVIIDEEALGTLDFVSAHGVALPPGVHHVTVKAAGYFPSDVAVDARPGTPPVALEIALIPVPD
jgi:PEGA domain